MDYLVLKRASASRPSGEWNDDDFDVLADGVVVGRIVKAAAVPVGTRAVTPPPALRECRHRGLARWPFHRNTTRTPSLKQRHQRA